MEILDKDVYFNTIKGDYEKSNFWRFFNIKLTTLKDGEAEIFLPLKMDNFGNTRGIVHGGVASSLLDSVSGICLKSVIGQNQSLATLNLSVNYTRPSNGKAMIALGKVVTKGRRIATISGELYDENKEKLLATSTGTFMII